MEAPISSTNVTQFQSGDHRIVRLARSNAYRIVASQLVLVLLLGFVWVCIDWHAGLSVLLGGCALVLPNFVWARCTFATIYARNALRIIKAFYLGEAVKLILMITIVVIITCCCHVVVLPFFCGLVSAQMGVWFAPFVLRQPF